MRRTMRGVGFLGLAVVVVVLAIAHEIRASPWMDARGLEFVSQEAFCTYHCSTSHIAQAYRTSSARASECLEANCGRFLHELQCSRTRRRLRPAFSFVDGKSLAPSVGVGDVHGAKEDERKVTVISLVSCSTVTDVTLSIGDPETDEFATFYPAFATAYDAMLAGEDAAYEACQLQFLQKELLTSFSADLEDESDKMEIKPSLIKLNPAGGDELACLKQIKQIWPATSESTTPFLTRSDQVNAKATIMLVHVSAAIGDEILALQCVESVTVLPAILKLMPFAKSSYALSRDSTKSKEGPALEIRLAKVVPTAHALNRLSTRVMKATGIKDLITMQSSTADFGGVLLQAAVDDYHTWTQALAIVLDDEAVEWVDMQQVVTTSSLQASKYPALEQRLLRRRFNEETDVDATEVEHTSRRLDDYVQDLVGVNIMHEHNITGSSIVVGITDTGLYIDHDQFDQESRTMYDDEDMTARKVVYYQTFANDVDEAEGVTCGHGTHVSGILAGSSYSKKNSDLGIASSARIAFMDIGKQETKCAGTSGCDVSLETPSEVANLMKAQVDTGARIFSFSWGTGANDYNAQTEQVDEYIYNNPEILIIVAAGNSGEKGPHTISSPSGAKNVVSVGASMNAAASFSATPCQSVLNEKSVASFSSIGPTLDGRQKPDLVAPGMSITSSQSETPGSTMKSSAMCPLQGTSQATPVIAGMAVLIYEWLRDGWWKNGVADPTFGMDTIPASLIKALLLHSGEPMSRRLIQPTTGVTSCIALEAAAKTLQSYPDFNQGYGKPTMLNLVSFLDSTSASSSASSTSSNTIYFFPNSSAGSEPSVTEGSEVTFHFMLTVGVNLRVTLVWTDPPASVGSKVALQNDLDLILKVPNTTALFYPLSGNGTRDSVNNVEMVEVSYDDVLHAVTEAGVAVKDGNIYVQAVVSGHSVKAGENATTTGQKFSIVASSAPSLTSVSSARPDGSAFWQPWVTIGAIVVGVLILLFVIALVWRMHVTRKAGNLKAGHGTPSAATALTGAGGGPGRREQHKRANEARTSVPHIHPNYRHIDAGGSRCPALEKPVGTSHRAFDPSAAIVREASRRAPGVFHPSAGAVHETSRRTTSAAIVHKPSRRTAGALVPPLPPPVGKVKSRRATAAAAAMPTAADRSHKSSRRNREFSDKSDRGPEYKRSDGSDWDHKQSKRRRERECSDRSDRLGSDRGQERSGRQDVPVKSYSTRRSKPPINM